MPEIPAFLAARSERWFGRSARAVAVEDMAPRLRRVRFEGAALRGVRYAPGQEIEFRVGDTALRHYTPSLYDGDRGALEVVFYLHGRGPGSAWASGLHEGSDVRVLGPGGSFGLQANAATHVFLGDETALGLFQAMARGLPASASIEGAVEVEPSCEGWPALVGLKLEGVARSGGQRGAPLRAWVERHAPSLAGAAFYLVGHTATLVDLRDLLINRYGVPRRSIRTKAYWADKKRGL